MHWDHLFLWFRLVKSRCVNMRGLIGFIVCVGLFISVNCAVAPFINPCQRSNQECLKISAQKAVPILAAGVPELGLRPLDPMHMARVKASQAGLDMDFRDTVVKGLRNCVVMSLKRQGSKMYFEIKCSVTLIGDYTIGGRLLILPIEGDGRYKIKIRDIVVSIVFDLGERELAGEKHWRVVNWKHSADVKTNAEFQFQNLFHGNKQLSDTIHQFANANWKDIFQEVAPPIVKAIVAKIVDETQNFFDKVPAKELSLD